MTAAASDPLASLNQDQEDQLIDEYEQKEREAIQSESAPSHKTNLANTVREYIDATEGIFTTSQIYTDLGIFSSTEKGNVRQILKRLREGKIIESCGNRAGTYRVINGVLEEMDLKNAQGEDLSLWLPLDLHNVTNIMPGNIIVVTGDPDAGKTAFLLNTIHQNLDLWQCHYFNSEMGAFEMRKRLDLFQDFPIGHRNFHPYERSDCFEDVIKPGKNTLNVIDYLEVTEDFFKIGSHLNAIHKNLDGAIAIVAIQKKNRDSESPLGGQRALEKPRLVISLSAGSRNEPNRATILKCKNRKTDHSMIGKSRTFKLIRGCEFRSESPVWS